MRALCLAYVTCKQHRPRKQQRSHRQGQPRRKRVDRAGGVDCNRADGIDFVSKRVNRANGIDCDHASKMIATA